MSEYERPGRFIEVPASGPGREAARGFVYGLCVMLVLIVLFICWVYLAGLSAEVTREVQTLRREINLMHQELNQVHMLLKR